MNEPRARYTPTRLLCPWGFSRQQYWSGLPCPPPGDLPNPEIKPRPPSLQVDSLPSGPPGKPPSKEKKRGVKRRKHFKIQFQYTEYTKVLTVAYGTNSFLNIPQPLQRLNLNFFFKAFQCPKKQGKKWRKQSSKSVILVTKNECFSWMNIDWYFINF